MTSDHLDIVLRVLDHQVVGPEREIVGKVDDLELTGPGTDLAVTGFAVGPGGLSQRLPGRLGAWVGAVWRRLSSSSDPQPVVVPVVHVADLGSAIVLGERVAEALQASFGLERWLRRHVVSRIPGAKGGEQETEAGAASGSDATASPAPGPEASARPTDPPTRPPRPGARWLSALLGAPVLDEDGHHLGDLIEVHCRSGPRRWTVTHLQVTRSALGTELGYHADPHQGPALLKWAFRRLQRRDLLVPVADITEIRDEPSRVVVSTRADRRHPHHDTDAP
ncbi:hypothetical protein [Intrasporangium sp. DVR]|uniref:hypothetical protein n=1 Tax=Intrasporangium sp. DVR TaxID=3127867 RepID=UPI00313A55E6